MRSLISCVFFSFEIVFNCFHLARRGGGGVYKLRHVCVFIKEKKRCGEGKMGGENRRKLEKFYKKRENEKFCIDVIYELPLKVITCNSKKLSNDTKKFLRQKSRKKICFCIHSMTSSSRSLCEEK